MSSNVLIGSLDYNLRICVPSGAVYPDSFQLIFFGCCLTLIGQVNGSMGPGD